jgi:hypothetical protein
MITKILHLIATSIRTIRPQTRSKTAFYSQTEFKFQESDRRRSVMRVARLALAMTAVFFSGCASVKFDVAEGDAAKVAYVQGNPVVPSKSKTMVFVSFSPEAFPANQRGCLNVTLANTSKSPVNFGPENITVSCDGVALKTFSYESLKREIQQRAAAAANSKGKAGAMQAAAASMPPTTTTQ